MFLFIRKGQYNLQEKKYNITIGAILVCHKALFGKATSLCCKSGRVEAPKASLSKRRCAGKSAKDQAVGGKNNKFKKRKWIKNLFLSVSPGYLALQETVLPAVSSYLLLRWWWERRTMFITWTVLHASFVIRGKRISRVCSTSWVLALLWAYIPKRKHFPAVEPQDGE